jgi:hypothetical protein
MVHSSFVEAVDQGIRFVFVGVLQVDIPCFHSFPCVAASVFALCLSFKVDFSPEDTYASVGLVALVGLHY